MREEKRCAVCGDTTKMNVRLAWKRGRDGKCVNVCCACAEGNRVNAKSIDNFTSKDTIYTGGSNQRGNAFQGNLREKVCREIHRQ